MLMCLIFSAVMSDLGLHAVARIYWPAFSGVFAADAGSLRALLVESPVLMNGKRSAFPVGINLFGSMRRIAMALESETLDAIGDRITELLTMKVPDGFIAKLSMLPKLFEVGKFPPRVRGGKPACQHIVLQGADIDLDALPLMKCWPEDGGAYITMPMVITAPVSSPNHTTPGMVAPSASERALRAWEAAVTWSSSGW